MKKFVTKTYEIISPKLKGKKSVRFVFLTDLHGVLFDEKQERLYQAVCEAKPDAVLVTGDMIVRDDEKSLPMTADLMLRLVEKFPVCYALGNHEYKMLLSEERRDSYLKYERELTDAGVCFLHNERTGMELEDSDFVFHGLEIPIEYYKKPKSPKLSLKAMEQLIGTPSQEGFHILLAHNPKYGNTYFSWGADLILSGHYHGGILRLSEHCGVTSPQFLLFPPYCCGDFHKNDRHMIVSAGLGEHTIPIRIHNPRELLVIDVKPLVKTDNPG